MSQRACRYDELIGDTYNLTDELTARSTCSCPVETYMYIPVSVVSVSLCFVEAIVASPEEEDDHLKRFFTHNRNMPKKP